MVAVSSTRLLIVEDDAGVARLQSKYLERAGYDAVTAASAAEAIQVVSGGGIDLILLDYSLPDGMTGLDLQAQLLSQGHDIPVIMVTGCSDEFTSVLAIRSGVKDFVHKSAEYLDYLPVAVDRILTQHATERALAESEARFRAVSDAANDGIVAIDSLGRIISWNAGAQRIFGYSVEEIIGREFSDLTTTQFDCVEQFGSPQIGQAAQRRKPLELRGLKKDGTPFPMELSFGAWHSNDQTFFSGIIRDVAERKASEELLRQRDEQLRQSQKMEAVGTLAGGLAHEFNNLLQAIQAYTHFAMEEMAPDGQTYRDLEQVLCASERAAALTRQLLSFGRQQNLDRTHVDPNQLIKDLLKMTRPLIGEHIAIKTELAEQPICIHVDPGQFQQLLMNLCLNARDSMPSGGEIVVSSERLVVPGIPARDQPHALEPGSYFYLTVRDTGTGMTPEVMSHVFEPFFTTKATGKGTGLGLAMVYGMVQQHQGAIRLDSTVGVGTTFHIYLPVVDAVTAGGAEKHPPQNWPGHETLLVAEDEPLVRETFVRILRGAGYRLLVACDGEEALEIFGAHADEIDLLLLDVVMPKLGGREFLVEARKRRPDVTALFCSGYDPDRTRGDSVSESGCSLLQKPFDAETLLRTVRTALDRRTVGAL